MKMLHFFDSRARNGKKNKRANYIYILGGAKVITWMVLA